MKINTSYKLLPLLGSQFEVDRPPFLPSKGLTTPRFCRSPPPLRAAVWQWVVIQYLSAPPGLSPPSPHYNNSPPDALTREDLSLGPSRTDENRRELAGHPRRPHNDRGWRRARPDSVLKWKHFSHTCLKQACVRPVK